MNIKICISVLEFRNIYWMKSVKIQNNCSTTIFTYKIHVSHVRWRHAFTINAFRKWWAFHFITPTPFSDFRVSSLQSISRPMVLWFTRKQVKPILWCWISSVLFVTHLMQKEFKWVWNVNNYDLYSIPHECKWDDRTLVLHIYR